MQHNLVDLDSFRSSHQCVRQFVTEHRQKQCERGSDAQSPGHNVSSWRQMDGYQLHRMFANIRGDDDHTEREHKEPAIVDEHGNPVNSSDHDLAFEKRLEHEAAKSEAQTASS